MCGIYGIIGAAGESATAAARMAAALRHRGPDDEGGYRDSAATLGHLRLSVIDIEGGHQPMSNEDDTLHLVCNGEIYNYRELRRELEARGHRFKTRCDNEVVLHVFEESGAEGLHRLNGMFAFAIWDARRRRLFLARDRLGVKPLFHARADAGLIFASELKGVLAHPATRREVDPEALDLYLSLMFTPAPRTIARGVEKLCPGHWMTWEAGRTEQGCWWRLPAETSSEPMTPALVEECRALLADSVRLRLASDAPLGAYLSGGLDSSLVCALMAREAGPGAVNAFTVGFGESEHDERSAARAAAAALGVRHRELEVAEDALAELQRIIWHLDEPVADAAAIPTYLMARLTKRHATVVLTGEGADELFAGYPYYKALKWGERWGGWLPAVGAGRNVWGRWRRFRAVREDRAAAYLALKAVFTAEEKRELLAPPWARESSGPGRAYELALEFFSSRGEFLAQAMRFESAFWLPDDLLTKVDRMTMAHAVEAREPYLDYRLVERVMPLPVALKLRGFVGKRLLREMGRGLLPERARMRAKRGFTVPISRWAARDGGILHGLLDGEAARRRGFFQPEALARLDVRGAYGRRRFWTLAALELWCRCFLDRDPASPP